MLNKTTSDPDLRDRLAEIASQESRGRHLLSSIVQGSNSLAISKALQQTGYARFSPVFDAQQIEDIKSYFYGIKTTTTDGSLTYYDIDDVVRAPGVLDLACHPDFLSAVGDFLGTAPTILDLAAWRTDVTDRATVGAQVPHRDRDDFRFCKLFVYLTDVGPEDGPHVYLPLSHSKSGMQDLCERRGLCEESLEQAFDSHSRGQADWVIRNFESDMLEHTGPAGTAFLENTFGFHFGKVPKRSARFMFQVLYGQIGYEYRAERLRRTHDLTLPDHVYEKPLSRYACRLIGRA